MHMRVYSFPVPHNQQQEMKHHSYNCLYDMKRGWWFYEGKSSCSSGLLKFYAPCNRNPIFSPCQNFTVPDICCQLF